MLVLFNGGRYSYLDMCFDDDCKIIKLKEEVIMRQVLLIGKRIGKLQSIMTSKQFIELDNELDKYKAKCLLSLIGSEIETGPNNICKGGENRESELAKDYQI